MRLQKYGLLTAALININKQDLWTASAISTSYYFWQNEPLYLLFLSGLCFKKLEF